MYIYTHVFDYILTYRIDNSRSRGHRSACTAPGELGHASLQMLISQPQ